MKYSPFPSFSRPVKRYGTVLGAPLAVSMPKGWYVKEVETAPLELDRATVLPSASVRNDWVPEEAARVSRSSIPGPVRRLAVGDPAAESSCTGFSASYRYWVVWPL